MARSEPGRPFCSPNAAPATSSCSRRARSATAPAAAPRAWCAPRAAPRPPSGSACAARSSTPPAAIAIPLDCGFVAQGYLMPCFTDAEVARRTTASRCSSRLGLDVEWLSSADIDDRDTGMAPGVTLGALVCAGRRLHRRAAQRAGLHRRADRASASTSGSAARSPACGSPAAASSASTPPTARSTPTAWCSPAGPSSARSARTAGGRIPAGGTRHQVVVTAPLPSRRRRRPADGLRRHRPESIGDRGNPAACCGE